MVKTNQLTMFILRPIDACQKVLEKHDL